MADLGFREDPKAEEQLRVTSRYAQPKSATASDEELGLRSGPITKPSFLGFYDATEQDPGKLVRDEIAAQPTANDPLEVDPVLQAGLGAAMSEAGGAGVGALVKGAKALMPVLGKIPGRVLSAEHMEKMRRAIDHTANETIHGAAGSIIGDVVVKPALKAAANAAPKVVAGAGKVASMAAAAAPSPISNAMDKLRASAATNQRAQDLLNRIDAMSQSPQLPNGTVTQSTGVSP